MTRSRGTIIHQEISYKIEGDTVTVVYPEKEGKNKMTTPRTSNPRDLLIENVVWNLKKAIQGGDLTTAETLLSLIKDYVRKLKEEQKEKNHASEN